MTKQLRVKLNYSDESDKDIAAKAVAVLDGLTGNANFANAPVDLATLKSAIDAYASAIAAALDGGGKKATIGKNKQRAVVVKMLRTLGHWVEANCKEDPAILKSSGFVQASTTRASVQPLQGPPSINKVTNGPNSGQLVVKVNRLAKALSYTVHYTVIGVDGKLAPWTELPPLGSTRPVTVAGLIPGTNYTFQVRALGRLGYTDWSDSVTHMSM